MGVLTNGVPYSGGYGEELNMDKFLIGPGVAPEAKLYALKVFGCKGTTGLSVDAMEWAADPDADGDLSDRLDVVNLSLGTRTPTRNSRTTPPLACSSWAVSW